MLFVLQDINHQFYAGTCPDKFDIQRPHLVEMPSEAMVFRARLDEGKVIVEPELPGEGIYEMKAVRLEL